MNRKPISTIKEGPDPAARRRRFRIFLAGIIQGSRRGRGIHGQGYRRTLKGILEQRFPKAEVYCPVERHPESLRYGAARARAVFRRHVEMVRRCDLLVVYLPSASMGSAVEMWEARRSGRPEIWVISPLSTNWVILLLADRVFPGLGAFREFLGRSRCRAPAAARGR